MKIVFDNISKKLEDKVNELKIDGTIESTESTITLILKSLIELKQIIVIKGPYKILDSLREALIRKMDEDDKI